LFAAEKENVLRNFGGGPRNEKVGGTAALLATILVYLAVNVKQ